MTTDPLAVAIDDGSGRRMVTKHVSDLSFSETAPGGHRVGSCRIDLPLSSFPNLGPNDKMYVFDTATGGVPFEGYTNNPGKRDDATGESFDLTANGGMILAADRFERLIYRDTSLDNWTTDNNVGARGTVGAAGTSSGATAQVDKFPKDAGTRAGDKALFLQFPKGMAVDSSSQAFIRYRQFAESPMALGAVRYFIDGGSSTSNYQFSVGIEGLTSGSPEFTDFGDLISTGHSTTYISSNNLTDREVFVLFMSDVTTEVASNNAWLAVGEFAALGKPVDRYGVAYDNPRTGYWLASEVAEDLFGRLLVDQVDQATLDIVTSGFQIDTLTFLDPTTAAGAFEALLTLEDYDWQIRESTLAGKHKAWFRPWPTTPRYVLTDSDAVDLPGSDETQVNRVTVEWLDSRQNPHTMAVGAYVPELGNKNPVLSADGRIDPTFTGRIKDADKITLPDGHGSAANALQAGTLALAEKNRLTYSGTATVTRPLLDLVTGARVMPWNLRAGTVVRLASQGVDVRVTEKAYSHNDRAATLTLNTPVPSLVDLLARFSARKRR